MHHHRHAQAALFALAQACMGPLLVLQRAYRREPSVTCLILRLAGDTVEAHVSFLQVWQKRELNPLRSSLVNAPAERLRNSPRNNGLLVADASMAIRSAATGT